MAGENVAMESISHQNSEGCRPRSGVLSDRGTSPSLASNLLITCLLDLEAACQAYFWQTWM